MLDKLSNSASARLVLARMLRQTWHMDPTEKRFRAMTVSGVGIGAIAALLAQPIIQEGDPLALFTGGLLLAIGVFMFATLANISNPRAGSIWMLSGFLAGGIVAIGIQAQAVSRDRAAKDLTCSRVQKRMLAAYADKDARETFKALGCKQQP